MTALSILGTSAQPLVTMSSREIADLVESRHADVVRSIQRLMDAGVIQGYAPTAYTHPQNGQTYECFMLNKRDSYVVVAQLSPQFTARLVDRWQELETEQQSAALNPANLSRMQLIELAMQAEQERIESEKARQALEVKVEAMAPQVQAFERIAKSDGSLCLTDAAKTLQIQPKHLTQFLQANHWIYRRPLGIGWLAYQDKIQAGHLEHKVTTGEKSDGSEWTNTQVRVTPKGLTRLAALLAQTKAIAA